MSFLAVTNRTTLLRYFLKLWQDDHSILCLSLRVNLKFYTLMIHIKTSLLPSLNSNSIDTIAERIKIRTYNLAASDFAKKVQDGLKNLKCSDHPNSDQSVVIQARPDGIRVLKQNFCCKKFEDQVQITVKN